MKKLGLTLGIVLLVAVVVSAIFVATFDVNKYRGTIQTRLEQQLGRSVSLGEMRLQLFPLRFGVQNIAISDDPSFTQDTPFLKAQELDVALKLMPLLHKQLKIESLRIERPSVSLIKNAAGVWNLASLGQTTASRQPETSSDRQLSLGTLALHDGQVTVLDQQHSKLPTLYDHIDLSVADFEPNHPFNLEASVHMAGSSQEIKVTGKAGPLVSGQPAATPFQGNLKLDQVGFADLAKFLNTPALAGSDGTLTGETKIEASQGKISVQGETNLQNVKVKGTDLGYPIVARYDLVDDLPADLVAIKKLTLLVGSTPIELAGTLNLKPSPVELGMRVRANNVAIAEVAKLLAASGIALPPGTAATGNAGVDIDARGPATQPNLNGSVTASDVRLTGKELAQPVSIPALTLSLTPTQIKSAPFNLMSGGTTLNAQLGVRNYTSARPNVDVVMRAVKAQLPAILSLAKAYGVTALDKFTGAGTMNLDLHASGDVSSLTKAEIIKALNGSVSLNFNDVKYSGANFGQQLSAIAGLFDGGSTVQGAQGITNIQAMTGDILVRNGIAQTSNLQARLDIGKVGAAGTANLENEALNMRVTAILAQTSAQKAGQIGGMVGTALANNEGQLVIPALVTGTFSNPKFAPDVEQLAQMKLKGLIPTLNNPSSIMGTLGSLLGKKASVPGQPQQQTASPKPSDPVQQIMGIFGKKKQEKPH